MEHCRLNGVLTFPCFSLPFSPSRLLPSSCSHTNLCTHVWKLTRVVPPSTLRSSFSSTCSNSPGVSRQRRRINVAISGAPFPRLVLWVHCFIRLNPCRVRAGLHDEFHHFFSPFDSWPFCNRLFGHMATTIVSVSCKTCLNVNHAGRVLCGMRNLAAFKPDNEYWFKCIANEMPVV